MQSLADASNPSWQLTTRDCHIQALTAEAAAVAAAEEEGEHELVPAISCAKSHQ